MSGEFSKDDAEVLNPEWDKAGRVHDWRNYATDELIDAWHTFTDEQKAIIANALQAAANKEEWD